MRKPRNLVPPVTRYDIESRRFGTLSVNSPMPSPMGEYVLYTDYAQTVAAYEAQLDMAEVAMRAHKELAELSTKMYDKVSLAVGECQRVGGCGIPTDEE